MTLYYHSDPEEMEFGPADFVPTNVDQERFYRECHHVHFPKLEDGGFVEWDREQNCITPQPRFEELQPFLDLLEDFEDFSYITGDG